MADQQDDAVDAAIPLDVPTASLSETGNTKQRDIVGWIVLGGGTIASLWGLVASIGSGFGFWDWSVGLRWIHWSAYLGLATLAFGIFMAWRARKAKSNPPRFKRWLGILISVAYVGWLMSYVIAGWSVPDIHDVSTDLADPPEFRVLATRPDNLDDVPGINDPAMAGMSPRQRWALVHQKSYGDIRAVRIDQPVISVIEKAKRLADDRGWETVAFDPVEGRLEATETSPLFRFKEDIVVRVRASDSGTGSIVDMRSVSRVGDNDQGSNAKRVREFLADLSGTVSTAQ